MTVGELVSASVVDQRVYDVQGDRGSNGVYLLGVPGRALPFVVYRAWKIGTGTVTESVDFYGPSGRLVYRWGPVVRRLLGPTIAVGQLNVAHQQTNVVRDT